jgi:sulfopropanediol 3-dehydrogenase
MAVYLKKATMTSESLSEETRETVTRMLRRLENGGEAAARELSAELDRWTGKIVLPRSEIEKQIALVPKSVRDDLDFAHERIRAFAQIQRESLKAFEIELYPGLTWGQRLIPCMCAGCYVPGGRFAHAASALMSIATAKAAGVPFVAACSPPRQGGIHPAVLYAMVIGGADVVLVLGGVQAIGAMAYGLFTGKLADVIVGPGNRFVAEAKRLLFGKVGIDVIAGPSESLVLADRSGDPHLIAVDLVSQAEHGYDSPVWFVTDDIDLAKDVMERVPKLIAGLPSPEVAMCSWRDYGEVIVCSDREEMARVSDDYAAEHVQVMAEDLDWWLERLVNYGSLFLGEEASVAFGDKTSGPNHILPTKKAARYSGGLGVSKFIKTVTYQRLTREAVREIAAVTSRISRLEGMEGHARTGDARLKKFFPNEEFNLGTLGDSST